METAFAKKKEKLQDCQCSFYSLINRLMPEGSNTHVLHRFCSLMRKMSAKSFVEEDLLLNGELSDEKQMLEIGGGGKIDFQAKRLTFFCLLPDSRDWYSSEELSEEYILGYVIIVKFTMANGGSYAHILESVVKTPRISKIDSFSQRRFYEPVTNYYIHNVNNYKTVIGTEEKHRKFSIQGIFFTQQNGYTSVCAHASLRTALNSSPLLKDRKLTNKEINDTLGISDYYRRGLSKQQIEEVVKTRGYRVHSIDFSKNTSVDYDRFLYPTLESCFPTILGIEYCRENKKVGHVVSVLGHTSNFDRWAPEADRGYGNYPLRPYISGAEWCDHYVISDDNYGMYGTLPSKSIQNFIVPSKNPNPHASMAITIVPEEVKIQGYIAEQLAVRHAHILIETTTLAPPEKWLTLLKNRYKEKTEIVCRTLLQAKENYVKFISERNRNMTPQQRQCIQNASDYVWVTEVSLPDVYSANKHKLGDVVINADVGEKELISGDWLVWAWLPGFVQLRNTAKLQLWNINTHIPLIRNTMYSLPEW